MALLQVNYFATSISKSTTFQLALPNDVFRSPDDKNPHYEREMKTLILLHGYCGYCNDWLISSPVCELANRYNVAIVMPSGDNSFYVNGPASTAKYEDFICVDLIKYLQKTFGLAMRPEDTFIGGLSMGGFGGLHSGLAHPEVFGKMFGLSSALIADAVCKLEPGTGNPVANYEYYAQTFGNPKELENSRNNPKFLVKDRVAKGERIQPVFMACGTEDFLIGPNREFRDFLIENGVDVTFKESTGVHDWKFWNEYIEPAIKWCLDAE